MKSNKSRELDFPVLGGPIEQTHCPSNKKSDDPFELKDTAMELVVDQFALLTICHKLTKLLWCSKGYYSDGTYTLKPEESENPFGDQGAWTLVGPAPEKSPGGGEDEDTEIFLAALEPDVEPPGGP